MLCRIASGDDYSRPALERFNVLVTVRKSWSYWFLARSIGGGLW